MMMQEVLEKDVTALNDLIRTTGIPAVVPK